MLIITSVVNLLRLNWRNIGQFIQSSAIKLPGLSLCLRSAGLIFYQTSGNNLVGIVRFDFRMSDDVMSDYVIEYNIIVKIVELAH